MVVASPSPPACLKLADPAPDADWATLCAELRQRWHVQVHAQAGRWRVHKAELFLGRAWASLLPPAQQGQPAAELPAALRELIGQLQTDVVQRVVLANQPHLSGAELHLHWLPWQAAAPSPPAAARSLPPVSSLVPSPPVSSTPVSGVSDMSLFSRFRPAAAQNERPAAVEPALNPKPVAPPPAPARQQLPHALGQVAQHILAQERAMLDNLECRYAVRVLTFWVNTDSQLALRSLMDLNQKNPAMAREFVQTSFAKHCPDAQKLLNTAHLRLEFQPGDALPRETTQVLLVVGQATVSLPFSYEGEIDLGTTPQPSAQPPAVGATPSHRSTQLTGQAPEAAKPAAAAAAPASGQRAVLVLWAQWPNTATLHRWRFDPAELGGATAIWLGADPSTDPGNGTPALPQHTLQTPDLSHISSRHLKLVPPTHAGEGWQVVDTSSNGSALFNPHDDAGERSLTKHQAQPLPKSGALRLAPPSPSPVLLHFSQTLPRPAAAAPSVVPMRPVSRKTDLC